MAQVRKLAPAPARPNDAAQAPRALPAPAAAAPALAGSPAPGDAVLAVERLQKTFGDGTRAVEDVSFAVRRGEIFGLLGPNGAGKTTTMRILGTLTRATSGSASVLGLDVAREPGEVRRRIGFALQEVGLDDLATAREMLVFHARIYGVPRAEARARAAALLRQFGLAEHAERRVTRFSGGMKRRLDLAASLIHGPEVLILDEPSTGLDPKSRADLWATLRSLRRERGLTILMSTHYMDEADALCDRIAIVSRGRVVAIDTPEGLKRSLGGDVLRIQLARPAGPEGRARLEAAFGPGRVAVHDGRVDVRAADGARDLLPVLQRVAGLGLEVAATRVVAPTLDDVFRHYTGERLEEAPA